MTRTSASASLVEELRGLIVSAAPAPDAREVEAVLRCSDSQRLDEIMPFSSIALLGVIVAAEDRFGITITRREIAGLAAEGGATLRSLASLVERLRAESGGEGGSGGER